MRNRGGALTKVTAGRHVAVHVSVELSDTGEGTRGPLRDRTLTLYGVGTL